MMRALADLLQHKTNAKEIVQSRTKIVHTIQIPQTRTYSDFLSCEVLQGWRHTTPKMRSNTHIQISLDDCIILDIVDLDRLA